MFTTLLFDMDNTLYPESSGLAEEMSRRINLFVSEKLSLDQQEARRLRKKNLPIYGTTLEWLIQEQGLTDTDAYHRAIHPADLENYLSTGEDLKIMLDSLPFRKVVLTNAPPCHANRVLSYLGIDNCFEAVFDITYNEGKGKPHESTYHKVMDALGVTPRECLLIDDSPMCLIPLEKMGGGVLLVDEKSTHHKSPFPRIKTIEAFPGYLAELAAKEQEVR